MVQRTSVLSGRLSLGEVRLIWLGGGEFFLVQIDEIPCKYS